MQPHGGQAAQQESCRDAAQRAARKIGEGRSQKFTAAQPVDNKRNDGQRQHRADAAGKGLMLPQIGQAMEQGKQQHAAPGAE